MKNRTTLAFIVLAILDGFPASPAFAGAPVASYERAVLVSWDGVRRDTLLELLEVESASQPCWSGGTVFPVDTGRVDGSGNAIYTCLPTLAGVKPAGVPADSPAYGPFQVIASHVTNDGVPVTKPQHASLLSGYDCTQHGMLTNVSTARMPEGATIYERLMNAFDPIGSDGRRDGFVFRTLHAASKKFAGSSITFWAKRSKALQFTSGNGSEAEGKPGPLVYAIKGFARWRAEALERGLPDPGFFVFLHFKQPDVSGHIAGDGSRYYREAIVTADKWLYQLRELLRSYGWDDAAILVTTDHGFHGNHHTRNGGRDVFNTWIAAHNVTLTTDHIPVRTAEDYCASHDDPQECLLEGPDEPMPPEDVVPNVFITDVMPTLLDMYGVEWRTTTALGGESLYVP